MGIPGVKDSRGFEITDDCEVFYSHQVPKPGPGKGGTVVRIYYNGTVSVRDAVDGKIYTVSGGSLQKVI